MSSSCVITFNENPDGVYNCGQFLSGKIKLTTDKIKAIRGIHIVIRGYSEVRWSETRSGGGTRRVYFRAHEEYFNSKTEVMTVDNGCRFDLLPGNYEYNYQIHLPRLLPSSFRGSFGEIRYEVILTIDRPWRFDNVFKQPFTVISPLDLNSNPIYRQPIDKSIKKHFSKILCCGDGGEMLLTGHIPHCGFAPGQYIPIEVYVRNFSSIGCQETKIKLVKITEYRSSVPHTKRKYHTVVITEQIYGPLDNFLEDQMSCCLRIPPIPPTTSQTCRTMEISYCIEIQLRTKGLHTNMEFRMPITIGTIPLFYGGKLAPNIITIQPSSRLIKNDEIPARIAPPSYENAMQIDMDYINDTDESQHIRPIQFLPKYPVYYEFDEMVLDRKIYRKRNSLTETKERY